MRPNRIPDNDLINVPFYLSCIAFRLVPLISQRVRDEDSSRSDGEVEVIEPPQNKLKFTLSEPEKDKIDALTQDCVRQDGPRSERASFKSK